MISPHCPFSLFGSYCRGLGFQGFPPSPAWSHMGGMLPGLFQKLRLVAVNRAVVPCFSPNGKITPAHRDAIFRNLPEVLCMELAQTVDSPFAHGSAEVSHCSVSRA